MSTSTNNNITLANGKSVDSDFLATIKVAVMEGVTKVSSNKVKFELSITCGEEFWGCLTVGEKRSAGWCMRHLVATGEVPFVIVESKHEYPLYYSKK